MKILPESEEKSRFVLGFAPKSRTRGFFEPLALETQVPVQNHNKPGPRCGVSVFKCGERSDVNHPHHVHHTSTITTTTIGLCYIYKGSAHRAADAYRHVWIRQGLLTRDDPPLA